MEILIKTNIITSQMNSTKNAASAVMWCCSA